VARRGEVSVGSLQWLGHVVLTAVIVAGCADLQRLVTPSPPPETPPPVKREPPPPVLSPQVGRGDEDRLRREANGRIQKTEQIVAQIDRKRLAKDQQETYSTIQNFLTNAKEALATRDFPRASNLADKARILAEDLLRSVQ